MILYVDCAAGLSGDMLLAAFLNMGLPLREISRRLGDLNLSSIQVHPHRVREDGIWSTRISVTARKGQIPLPQRAGDFVRWVEGSRLSSRMKQLLSRVWITLAAAEGKVHRCSWEEVVFHHIRKIDTMVSFVGFCVGLIYFRIRLVKSSPIPVGHWHQDHEGQWRSAPAPATRELLSLFPTNLRREHFEWTTPTGAALLRAFGVPGGVSPLRVMKVGHGVGTMKNPLGIKTLRLILGQEISST